MSVPILPYLLTQACCFAIHWHISKLISLVQQGPDPHPAPWGSFLASLQASHVQQQPSAQNVIKNWAGTVHWNNIWAKSVETEAAKEAERQQEVVRLAEIVVSEASQAQTLPSPGTLHSDNSNAAMLSTNDDTLQSAQQCALPNSSQAAMLVKMDGILLCLSMCTSS